MTMTTTVRRLGRYGVTGGAAAVVDVGLFTVLTPHILATAPAATCSFLAAAVVNYALTSRYVFQARMSWRRLAAFLVFALMGLTVNVAVTVAAVQIFQLPRPLAKIAGIGMAFLLNFWLNNTIVFRQAGEP